MYNVNPDEANKALIESQKDQDAAAEPEENISAIYTNGNGQITIAEAKAAGFKMPITRDHWLCKYMDDRDGDGNPGFPDPILFQFT